MILHYTSPQLTNIFYVPQLSHLENGDDSNPTSEPK